MAQKEIETYIGWCEPGWAFFSSNEKAWINKFHKLKQQHPDEVVIMNEPETNNGVLYGKFPQKWTRIHAPRVVHMDDAKRAKLAENLRLHAAKRTQEE